MSRQTIEQRVARGIALLNEKGPRGWRRRVRVTRLDIRDGDSCVLGQVYDGFTGWFDGRHYSNGYAYGTDASPLASTLRRGERASTYGFVSYENPTIEADRDEDVALTAEWRRQLRQVPR